MLPTILIFGNSANPCAAMDCGFCYRCYHVTKVFSLTREGEKHFIFLIEGIKTRGNIGNMVTFFQILEGQFINISILKSCVLDETHTSGYHSAALYALVLGLAVTGCIGGENAAPVRP